ncbi:hypothetical protein D3C87_2113450 [compost metagenome]
MESDDAGQAITFAGEKERLMPRLMALGSTGDDRHQRLDIADDAFAFGLIK